METGILMVGTIRSFTPAMQKKIHERINQVAVGIAESAGAQATVKSATSPSGTWSRKWGPPGGRIQLGGPQHCAQLQ